MTLSIKPRLSKKCIGFIMIFPLLIVTSLVNVECPVCEGYRVVSSALARAVAKKISVQRVRRISSVALVVVGLFFIAQETGLII